MLMALCFMARFIKMLFRKMKLEDLINEALGNQWCALQENTRPCSLVHSVTCACSLEGGVGWGCGRRVGCDGCQSPADRLPSLVESVTHCLTSSQQLPVMENDDRGQGNAPKGAAGRPSIGLSSFEVGVSLRSRGWTLPAWRSSCLELGGL